MTQINPFAGAIAQTPQAQRLAAIDRDAQLVKTATKKRAEGYTDQHIDEFVESADAVDAVGDDDQHHEAPKKRRKPSQHQSDDEFPHLDVRA